MLLDTCDCWNAAPATPVRSVFSSVLAYFLTPAGVFVLGVLDSSLVFFMPMGLDVVVILLAARNPDLVWLIPLLATGGGLAGSAVTFWIGRKVGEHGLSRLIRPSRLERVQRRIRRSAAPAVAALGIIPPPFPFTPFILAGGAFGLSVWRFFSTLAAVKLVRFGLESLLAARLGTRIVQWTESTAFEVAIGVVIVLALVGTGVSIVLLFRRRTGMAAA